MLWLIGEMLEVFDGYHTLACKCHLLKPSYFKKVTFEKQFSFLCNFVKPFYEKMTYHKVPSGRLSQKLLAHIGFFRLLMYGILDAYIL